MVSAFLFLSLLIINVKMMIKFEVYLGADNLFHWRLRASNGQIVCWSEGYSSRQGAEQSIRWVKLNAPLAEL